MTKEFIFRDFGVTAEEVIDILNDAMTVCDDMTEAQQNRVQCGLADQLLVVMRIFESLMGLDEDDDNRNFRRDFVEFLDKNIEESEKAGYYMDLYESGFITVKEAFDRIEKDATRVHCEKVKREMLAARIMDIDPHEARNNNATTETIADDIKNDPQSVIEYLLDTLENQ